MTDQQTDQLTDQPTDRPSHREISLLTIELDLLPGMEELTLPFGNSSNDGSTARTSVSG